ncbi:MAG: NYN domain-containing protein [Phaeodactylibacter sp.]|nr:NYN domain-containing protein [Phaeodactylibacter sp.]MCB9289410.1 NYN domain-containing protein [Lewinellaceae bacterium]
MPKNNNGSFLTKIGVFYDGNYFYHVSNYYNYVHGRKSRISIKGLHDFIRYKVSELEGGGANIAHCQIVDAHYFRGRLSAAEASNKSNQLYYDRVFDDILMSEGVTTHYLPLRGFGSRKTEKGVDVWLALEAFEQSLYKKFDVLVLIAADGDYVPLIRKVNSLGTRVMVLSWEFEFVDDYGNNRSTRTSQSLLEEVTYPIAMHTLIDNPEKRDTYVIKNLFVPKTPPAKFGEAESQSGAGNGNGYHTSTIFSLKEGYGFIAYPPNNLFFHYSEVENVDFNELRVGDPVKFRIGVNDETGQDIAIDVSLAE